MLEEYGPQSKKGNYNRNLFFTGHRKYCEDEEPEGAPRIHEIQGKEQEGSSEGHGMKIKDRCLLLRRIKQIEHSNANSSQFIAQPQTRQPECWKSSTRHYQRLNHQQRIGIRPD